MSRNWWNELYDEHLAEVLLVRQDPAEVDHTVRFLAEVLRLGPGARVFDQCCGIGSVAVPMARAGYQVVGIDQARAYIERGRADATATGTEVDLRTADAFEFVAEPACDAAFNWWTSFGYAATDADNLRMLARACESIRPGGRFALDFMNVPGVFRGFQPSVITRRSTPRGELVLLRESSIDLERGVLRKRWTYLLPGGGHKQSDSEVRLYMPNEIAGLLKQAGFAQVTLYGGIHGRPLDLDSPRLIAVAQKES